MDASQGAEILESLRAQFSVRDPDVKSAENPDPIRTERSLADAIGIDSKWRADKLVVPCAAVFLVWQVWKATRQEIFEDVVVAILRRLASLTQILVAISMTDKSEEQVLRGLATVLLFEAVFETNEMADYLNRMSRPRETNGAVSQ